METEVLLLIGSLGSQCPVGATMRRETEDGGEGALGMLRRRRGPFGVAFWRCEADRVERAQVSRRRDRRGKWCPPPRRVSCLARPSSKQCTRPSISVVAATMRATVPTTTP